MRQPGAILRLIQREPNGTTQQLTRVRSELWNRLLVSNDRRIRHQRFQLKSRCYDCPSSETYYCGKCRYPTDCIQYWRLTRHGQHGVSFELLLVCMFKIIDSDYQNA